MDGPHIFTMEDFLLSGGAKQLEFLLLDKKGSGARTLESAWSDNLCKFLRKVLNISRVALQQDMAVKNKLHRNEKDSEDVSTNEDPEDNTKIKDVPKKNRTEKSVQEKDSNEEGEKEENSLEKEKDAVDKASEEDTEKKGDTPEKVKKEMTTRSKDNKETNCEGTHLASTELDMKAVEILYQIVRVWENKKLLCYLEEKSSNEEGVALKGFTEYLHEIFNQDVSTSKKKPKGKSKKSLKNITKDGENKVALITSPEHTKQDLPEKIQSIKQEEQVIAKPLPTKINEIESSKEMPKNGEVKIQKKSEDLISSECSEKSVKKETTSSKVKVKEEEVTPEKASLNKWKDINPASVVILTPPPTPIQHIPTIRSISPPPCPLQVTRNITRAASPPVTPVPSQLIPTIRSISPLPCPLQVTPKITRAALLPVTPVPTPVSTPKVPSIHMSKSTTAKDIMSRGIIEVILG